MKFKAAVIVSGILHASLFALAFFGPSMSSSKSNGTPYYVRWTNISGGGGGKAGANSAAGKGQKAQEVQTERARMKDLTAKKQQHQSKLRYPDQQKKKKNSRQKPQRKKQSLISMKRKDPVSSKKPASDSPVSITRKHSGPGDLRTGISTGGGGSGTGTGSGNGSGNGSGFGSGTFPYAYYIEALRSKISSSWYNAVISPGIRGRFVTVVYFKIQRNGQVSEVEAEGKSGLKSLDLSAIRAVENASPFPPLPGDYPYSYLGVHFEFVWEKK